MGFALLPDFYFSSYREVDEIFLKKHGVRALLLDIDNTLEPYENPHPTEQTLAWFSRLSAIGIQFAFVSNNNKKRVDTFNQELGYVAFARAKKPFATNLRRAMKALGVSEKETLFMGDQILTDVLAAHGAGLRCVLVPPIRDKRDPFTRFKRLIERPILRRYERKKNL